MADWEITEDAIEYRYPDGNIPRQSFGIGGSLSGLRQGSADRLILDAGICYVNANISAMLAGPGTMQCINAENTWTDANGNLVKPRKLGETRNVLPG